MPRKPAVRSFPPGVGQQNEQFFEIVRQELSKSRIPVDGWYQDSVAASQTDVLLTRYTLWVAPAPGAVRALWVRSDAARAGGTLTIELFKNGTQLGVALVTLNATQTTFNVARLERSTLPFLPGDILDLRLTTTGAWSPTTANMVAGIEVELK